MLRSILALLFAFTSWAYPADMPTVPHGAPDTDAVERAVDEDGYDLWLRYRLIPDKGLRADYAMRLSATHVHGDGATLEAARQELDRGLSGLLGARSKDAGLLIAGLPARSPEVAEYVTAESVAALGPEGYVIRSLEAGVTVIASAGEAGVLYGAFHLLRLVQTGASLEDLDVRESPAVDLRLLNHWDNLDRKVERGYAGFSLWDWHKLPDYLDPRYTDYARANASVGVNGTVLTNVNADALVLTPRYLAKVEALARVFRPYGIRLYLTARFSAPAEIGGLETSDPVDPAVQAWWRDKADEIYARIPDFGGFLVKANSEGQPGPQDYGRTHAEGANMLADAVGPHGGVVMWRAFVYTADPDQDRAGQAYDEFKPLDGTFRDNVLVQVKNGPIDFQPREPFHPLFGAMPETPLMMEFQITKEYLGLATNLAYLGTLFEEVLQADTYVEGPGSTVARVVDGSLHEVPVTGIAGVSNVGTDRNWCGSHFACANWYAFGRLAWDPHASAGPVAEDWIRMTYTNDPAFVEPVRNMMMASRETVVNYMTPLGLHHIMAAGHHWGPGPWVDGMPRPDWTSVYYHRADSAGIGFDRTATGSGTLDQYAPEIVERWGDPDRIPEELLLWFHHVPWDFEMDSGRTLWGELALHYEEGVEGVRAMQATWARMEPYVDARRYRDVADFLAIQEAEARWWRDACLLYFQTFSDRPLPEGVEPPEHTLEYYRSLRFENVPGDPAG